MATRLDRLLLLLDTGSTPTVRLTAARQLGQLAAARVQHSSASHASAAAATTGGGSGGGGVGVGGGGDVGATAAGPSAVGEWRGVDGEWQEVVNLLSRILPYLRNKSWETRTAGGQAVEQVCKAVGVWDPSAVGGAGAEGGMELDHDHDGAGRVVKEEERGDRWAAAPEANGGHGSELADFDLLRILTTRPILLSSAGTEYRVVGGNTAEQQANAKKVMGLGPIDIDMGIDVGKELAAGGGGGVQDDDVKMEDAAAPPTPRDRGGSMSIEPSPPPAHDSAPPTPAPTEAEDLSGLSARELNALKRKRKLAGKLGQLPPPAPAKRRVVEAADGKPSAISPTEQTSAVVVGPASSSSTPTPLAYTAGEWPFASLVASLLDSLTEPAWILRHGAALGLLAVLRSQLAGALHAAGTLDACAAKICEVLARDRFGDYVGDQVVAPVRESAAQVLGVAVKGMRQGEVERVASVLSAMVLQDGAERDGSDRGTEGGGGPRGSSRGRKTDEAGPKVKYAWQVRHAGLLGLKYLVAVKASFISASSSSPLPDSRLLERIVEAALVGLRDPDDDVRAAAAGCLVPIAGAMVEGLKEDKVCEVLEVLWDALGGPGEGARGADDLASSVGNVMDLVAKLITFPSVLALLRRLPTGRSLPSLIPRLYPFFRHTISTVRLSVVRALGVFATMPDLDPALWLADARAVRSLFQNLIVEVRAEVRAATAQVWTQAIDAIGRDRLEAVVEPWVESWLRVVETPRGSPLDTANFFDPRSGGSGGCDPPAQQLGKLQAAHAPHNVDKPMLNADMSLVTDDDIWRSRLAGVDALAYLFASLPPDCRTAKSALSALRLVAGGSGMSDALRPLIATGWASRAGDVTALQSGYTQALLSEPRASYAELDAGVLGIFKECDGLVAAFGSLGKVPARLLPGLPGVGQGFDLELAKSFASTRYDQLWALVPKNARRAAAGSLEDRKGKLAFLIARHEKEKGALDVQRAAGLAGALVAMRRLPPKISPLIKSLTESLKFEENEDLQRRSAEFLTWLCEIATSPDSPLRVDPSPKIISNLATFLCQDTSVTPNWQDSKSSKRGLLLIQDSKFSATLAPSPEHSAEQAETIRAAKLLRRGSELALSALAQRFGDQLIERIPKLWSCMCEPLVDIFGHSSAPGETDARLARDDGLGQSLLDCLTVIPVGAERVPPLIQQRFPTLFAALAKATRSSFAIVRFAAARCYALLCAVTPELGLHHVIDAVLPLVADPVNVDHRRGAIELVARLVEVLDIRILAYVIFLVVPVLGRMSDPDDDVRFVATHTFASLIKLVPLEAGVPDPPGFNAEMLARRRSERDFLGQLLGTSQIEEYKIPVEISVDLRKYQREGISWLAFLAKYQLHGVLCDDMGLGKTLQSICILASKHHERAARYARTKSPDAVHLPSLVVCPPTLTGHWQHEIRTYAKKLKPLLYVGGPADRQAIYPQIKKHDVVIMSYDIVRNDIERLQKVSWNYCILDEGHIIKNGKAKLSKAVKQLKAEHRLVLSGTPIQNNALELWSLFDFLMPGFLGTEKAFNERFGKPISASRDAKSSSKEQEAGALALEALHKQVLPFLLRRLKEDVLDDLPPKIIQDHYCDLSPLQKALYEEFGKSKAKLEAEGAVKTSGESQHVFQALQYLKKLVNHPSLVYQAENPRHWRLLEAFGGSKGLQDLNHSPKLLALRQILRDCGIGLSTSAAPAENGVDAAASQHRVLIFCQMKEMLNIIERDVFAASMPTVTYRRLDGGTEASKRHAIVQEFNADPSIDCLLLTTHVGGLGLNLTGADTVIFVEHDWNPMKDLQAMDRAHRLGQKKVVNVYRLITKATLEEKIMGLQRFKLNIASSIVTQQNSNLASLDTDQILDLFSLSSADEAKATGEGAKRKRPDRGATAKNVLEGLDALPPEEEYSGFDAENFVASL